MAISVQPDVGEGKLQQRYQVTNWSEHDRALVSGSKVTIWFDEAGIRAQWTPLPPVGRGKPGWYSDTAIQMCLTIQKLFCLTYRGTEGLLKSLMVLCRLGLPVPDHTYLSRRAAQLPLKIPSRPRKEATHVVIDATGLKIYGKRSWQKAGLPEAMLHVAENGSLCQASRGTVCQGSSGKRRIWRKVQLAVDEADEALIGMEVITIDCGDRGSLSGLLDDARGDVAQVSRRRQHVVSAMKKLIN